MAMGWVVSKDNPLERSLWCQNRAVTRASGAGPGTVHVEDSSVLSAESAFQGWMWDVTLDFKFFLFFCNTGDWAQDLQHAGQVF